MGFGGFGIATAPSGPEFTAPATGFSAGVCAAAALRPARAWASDGVLATLAWILAAARLRVTAPITAGPRVKPKSRSMFAAPLAIPSRWFGTVSTSTADIESANPIPTRAYGAMTGPIPVWEETGTTAVHRSPIAVSARPAPIVQRG